jgi:glycosyltransferase involved in cell wall biosynthesis
MKILFFIDSLRAGGKERRFTELLKGITYSSNLNVEIVVMHQTIHYNEILDLNINIHYLIRKIKKDISVFWKFYRICKQYTPDIVHCWDDMTTIIAIPTCKLLNIKLVNGLVADTPVKRNILNKTWLRARLTFPFSDKIIGNSQAGLVAYNAPAKKSSCIYNGMDLNRFKNLENSSTILKEIFGDNISNIFVAGMVAAFEPRKDYKTLIKGAISLLSKNNSLRFILIGNGTDFIEMKTIVPQKLKDKIIFLGKRDNVESLINIFDVGILLTNTKVHGEGISNSIIEYMALGKPVIATKGGGTNELVVDNQNGYLIESNDSAHFEKCLQMLLDNKNLRIQLGNNAYELAHKKFDLKIMTRTYISMFNQVIGERS